MSNTLPYLDQILGRSVTLGEVLREVGLPLLGVSVGYCLTLWGIRKVIGLFEIPQAKQEKLCKRIRLFLRTGALLLISLSVESFFSIGVANSFAHFARFLQEPFYTSGKTRISVITLLLLIPVLYATSWVGKIVRHLLERKLLHHIRLSEERRFPLGSIVRYIAMSITFLFGMVVIGIDLSSMAVVLGVLGLGLGFGLKGVVENLFAGLMIASSGPIREKDYIRVEEIDGQVASIRLFNTVISTLDHQNIIIPNAQIIGNTVRNYSYDDRHIIICNTIQVAYKSDLDHVIRVMKQVGEAYQERLKAKDVIVRVASFDDSGITMNLRTWLKRVDQRFEAHSELNLALWRAFRKEGIEIPYPQLDLHIQPSTENEETSLEEESS